MPAFIVLIHIKANSIMFLLKHIIQEAGEMAHHLRILTAVGQLWYTPLI